MGVESAWWRHGRFSPRAHGMVCDVYDPTGLPTIKTKITKDL